MILNLIREAGAWSWFIFGFVLIGAEILVPGNVIVWLGLAGVVTGVLSFAFWNTGWWTWEIQWIAFAALSVLSVYLGRRFIGGRGRVTDEPYLNLRTQSLIGRTADLIDPIVNGYGRVRLGDTVWIVQGPDLPAGARVKVASATANELIVERA